MTGFVTWLFAQTYVLSGPGRETVVIRPEADAFDVKLVNLDADLAYEVRSYAPGFAYGSYSPEKAHVAGVTEQTIHFTRTWKSESRRLEGDELVVTVDPLAWGVVPSAIVPLIYRCLIGTLAAVPAFVVFKRFLAN